MNNNVARKLELLRRDFAMKEGRPFNHFFCPILFRDEEVELCYAHIINEAFQESDRSWTVQRADVDRFFGSAFESDFVILQDRGKYDSFDALADKTLTRKLRPKVILAGKEVEHYRPEGRVPLAHSELLLEREGKPTVRLALKLASSETLAAMEQGWEVRIDKDIRLAALVSLLKSAHLTMFEMVGYEYGLSLSGHFVGYDILGKFFLANAGKKKRAITANGHTHFRQFVNLVRPILSAPPELKGTVSDRLLYLCTSNVGAWAFLVLIRTGEYLHAVLLPIMEDVENAARFVSFLDHPSPQFEVKLARFGSDRWEVSPTPQTFIWPEANFS